MDERDVMQAELDRLVGVLAKIRDIVRCDDPRYPSLEWYRSKLDHIRRYLCEVFDEEAE